MVKYGRVIQGCSRCLGFFHVRVTEPSPAEITGNSPIDILHQHCKSSLQSLFT